METIPAPKLLQQWKLENLTIELAIDHILHHLVLLYEANQAKNCDCNKIETALTAININLAELRDELDRSSKIQHK